MFQKNKSYFKFTSARVSSQLWRSLLQLFVMWSLQCGDGIGLMIRTSHPVQLIRDKERVVVPSQSHVTDVPEMTRRNHAVWDRRCREKFTFWSRDSRTSRHEARYWYGWFDFASGLCGSQVRTRDVESLAKRVLRVDDDTTRKLIVVLKIGDVAFVCDCRERSHMDSLLSARKHDRTTDFWWVTSWISILLLFLSWHEKYFDINHLTLTDSIHVCAFAVNCVSTNYSKNARVQRRLTTPVSSQREMDYVFFSRTLVLDLLKSIQMQNSLDTLPPERPNSEETSSTARSNNRDHHSSVPWKTWSAVTGTQGLILETSRVQSRHIVNLRDWLGKVWCRRVSQETTGGR